MMRDSMSDKGGQPNMPQMMPNMANMPQMMQFPMGGMPGMMNPNQGGDKKGGDKQ